MTMQKVASLDAGMLYAETPEMPMHTMGVLVLEKPGHPLFEALRETFATRLPRVPVLRRRLVEGPLLLGDPHWIEDPAFSLDNHLHRAALPAPGGMRELAEFAGAEAGRLLDRSLPLWQVHVVERLRGGKVALVVKVHHAAMDGGKLVAMMGALMDLSAHPRKSGGPADHWIPDPEPSMQWLLGDAVRSLAVKPLHAARALAEVGGTLLRGGGGTEHEQTAARAAAMFEAPRTPFNGALSTQRVVAMADVAFEDLKLIKGAFGTTINDVVLAASCGALRAWLLDHGGLPATPLVANVPVTVRTTGGGDAEAGNRVSMILAHLPVQSGDPVQRLLAISAETGRAKARHGSGKGDVLRQAADVITSITVPWLLTQAMGLYSHSHGADSVPPPWNLVISNLPGPQTPLYCAGARVQRIYPFGPAQLGAGLNLTVMSTMDRLCLGAMACRRLVPDVDAIARQFVAEVALLRKRARKGR